jgi:hypothetical protein
VKILWPLLLLVGCGCAPMPVSRDRSSPAPPADAVEAAAVEFRSTLFRELSQRAAKASESDPGDWTKAAEAWREQQIEARRIANERLERAILDAAGEQAAWDRERWRSILQSLARGWGDE